MTKMIYRFDPYFPKASIHQYIDNIPDFVLVAKLVTGFHLAAYSESPLTQQNILIGKGFIVSLTSRKPFPVKNDKKAISYDRQYLIFGNSELRLSPHDRKIYSNLGINNAHFTAQKDSASILLGGSGLK